MLVRISCIRVGGGGFFVREYKLVRRGEVVVLGVGRVVLWWFYLFLGIRGFCSRFGCFRFFGSYRVYFKCIGGC